MFAAICPTSCLSIPDTTMRVGALLGERAKAAGVAACVFDRGGNRYMGRIAALAEGAREAGLEF